MVPLSGAGLPRFSWKRPLSGCSSLVVVVVVVVIAIMTVIGYENSVVNYYFAPVGLQSIVLSMSVCLSVHTHNSKTMQSENFFRLFACCLWPWLDPTLTAL